jgi:ATP-binding cassette subfamily C (CFTR/MRP) protein 4
MTAVERVLEYSDLDCEPLDKGQLRAPKDWPTKGEIVFEDVSFRYDKNLPNVLNGLTFRIESGEKIGVVGRTGVGKSSIVQTLFRMAEPAGTILIDGLNIKDICLHDLRNQLSIIPVNYRS